MPQWRGDAPLSRAPPGPPTRGAAPAGAGRGGCHNGGVTPPSPAPSWAIEPVGPLHGDVRISGSKNAVSKLMVAALLAEEPSAIPNAPRLGDVEITAGMLRSV